MIGGEARRRPGIDGWAGQLEPIIAIGHVHELRIHIHQVAGEPAAQRVTGPIPDVVAADGRGRGRIKTANELSDSERPRREAVETALAQGQPLDKPSLGIGMMDNVEIGSGRAVFLTLVAHGAKTIPVHIPRGNEADFKKFRLGELEEVGNDIGRE